MTSTLSIKLNLSGGLSDQNVNFDPTMIDINAKKSRYSANKSNVIYFPPTIKIRKQEVLNAGGGLSPIQVFTSPVYTNKLLQQYTNVRGYKPLSLKEAEKKGIIRDNFDYFFNLLFPKNGKILLNNIAYTIISSKIASTKIPRDAKKGENMIFKLNVDLRIIRKDKDTMVNRKRQSCKEQRAGINATLDALGWSDFGFDERDEDKPKKLSDTNLGPLYTSSSTGIATGKVKKSDPSKKQYYNPYGFPAAYAQPRYNSNSSSSSKSLPRAYPVAPPYINPYGPYASMPMYPVAPPKKISSATAGGGITRKRSSKKSKNTRRVHFV
jgi:hypothetical protein